MRRAAAIVALALLAVLLGGCGGTTHVRERTLVVTPNESGELPRTSPRPSGGVRIAVVTHGQASSRFWAIVRNGVEAAAYFVVAEALTNVARYADAARARVEMRGDGNGGIVVVVADDGVGGADPNAGSGLRGLQDRLAVIDGVLAIDSPPGRGTRLQATIPSPREHA